MPPHILRNELERNPELTKTFGRIYEESLNIWKEQHLYEYTTHGKQHTEQVEINLDSLTRPLQNSGVGKLTEEEIFILLSATCLHDIGMQRADDPDARRKHAQAAYDLILNSEVWVGADKRRVTLSMLYDRNARVAIANVARAHWTEYALQLPQAEFIVSNLRGRLRLLGLLLAMADLLDLSPVRARYFRSAHRLYDLSPLSELHQTMHDLVKGVQILPPNPGVPGALQFRLEWFDNDDTVQTMSEWVMQWFHSQWRQLAPALYEASGGVISWSNPWANVTFNSPQGPVPKLSPPALDVLKAERAEQARINRDAFVRDFRDAVGSGGASLFLLPRDTEFDSRALSDWCETDARLRGNCRVARVHIRPSATPEYFSGVISQLMEQWGEHSPRYSGSEALKHMKDFVTDAQTPSLVSIVRTDAHVGESLQELLRLLFLRPATNPAPARVCLLISLGAEGLGLMPGVSVIKLDAPPPREEVEQYLQSRRGYSAQESRDIYQRMLSLKLTRDPALVYTYIEEHCGLKQTA